MALEIDTCLVNFSLNFCCFDFTCALFVVFELFGRLLMLSAEAKLIAASVEGFTQRGAEIHRSGQIY